MLLWMIDMYASFKYIITNVYITLLLLCSTSYKELRNSEDIHVSIEIFFFSEVVMHFFHFYSSKMFAHNFRQI